MARSSTATYNFFFKLATRRPIAPMLATPLGVGDISLGEVSWALLRGGLYALGFLVLMGLLGLIVSPWSSWRAGRDADRVCVRRGGDGRHVVHANVAGLRPDPVVILPMFLFAATFFPLDDLPEPIRTFVQLTPLYHGVDLLRSADRRCASSGRTRSSTSRTWSDGIPRALDRVAAPRQAAPEVAGD